MKDKDLQLIQSFSPIYQGIVSCILILMISFFCYILKIKEINSWGILLSPAFLFCFYNPFLGIIHTSRIKYILKSFVMLIIIWLLIILVGCWMNNTNLKSVEQLHIIILANLLFYIMLVILSFVFSGILSFLKNVN